MIPNAALQAADLDWVVRPGYISGGYIFGFSQCLTSCLGAQLELDNGNSNVMVTVTVTATDLLDLKNVALATRGPNRPLGLKKRDVTDVGPQLTSTVEKA